VIVTAGTIAAIKAWWERRKAKSKEELNEEETNRRICEELAHAQADNKGWGRYGSEWVKYYNECLRTKVWERN
jgi:hypothetical protein